ncbi:MAG TPA: transglutaminaseTgpA domain-containing protein [Thermoanaerobaculia bacterium]|nr:transglutaminaseTgpA domain-containing protein [Thermoanaerobaculia bacterium]
MSFGRQKRLLLGWLALLAPLPLPFNGMVLWPVLALYLAGVLYFLRRASADPPRWLPRWAMNVLGLAYFPFFFLDLTAFSRGRVVQPAIHLCLFALLVKLFSMTRERDKWQTAMGIFFVFLAAMGTSVHPAIVLYLVAFLVLALVLLARFAFLHVLAGFGREDPSLARLPMRGFLWTSALATVLLAVPLFALLPRVRAPFIVGRSPGTGMTLEAAGFSDQVTLDSIGNIRNSRQVALRLLEEGRPGPDREIRFKGATYDLYQKGRWRRSPPRGPLRRERGVRFFLSRAEPERWVRIWLRPLRSRSLPLPVEAVRIEPRVPRLEIDEGGAVALAFDPFETVEYRVGLTDRPVLLGAVPGPAPDPTLDLASVTPRMTQLAARVMREGSGVEKAERLERYLIQNYDYTLDFRGRSAKNPIEDFLFVYRSGQCEYFASSMVLMLRSQGIPARLVTGFLGGEYNPFEGYYIVRDSNAHAWVEAYLPAAGAGGGWRVFDPTPPAGRPEARQESSWLLAQQAWDFMLFRWDRYVLTFGLYDQIRLFGGLRAMWSDFWGMFQRQDRGRAEDSQPAETGGGEQSEAASDPGPDLESALPYLIGIALLAALGGLLAFRLRSPLTATAAYRRLRRRLDRSGAPFPDSLPPLAVSREAAARFPEAARPAARVIDFYLRESFGGQELQEDEREALKEALAEAERGMRKAG